MRTSLVLEVQYLHNAGVASLSHRWPPSPCVSVCLALQSFLLAESTDTGLAGDLLHDEDGLRLNFP